MRSIKLKIVLLPEPEGPTNALTSPCGILNDTSSKIFLTSYLKSTCSNTNSPSMIVTSLDSDKASVGSIGSCIISYIRLLAPTAFL